MRKDKVDSTSQATKPTSSVYFLKLVVCFLSFGLILAMP